MDALQLQAQLAARLTAAGIVSAAAEARIIVREISAGNQVNAAQRRAALRIAQKRAGGVPLQYIFRRAPFREIELAVSRSVLIPRPETELLAGFFIDSLPKNATLLDLGTGSGAIALSVAFERPDLKITAVDASLAALRVARRNRKQLGLDGKVEIRKSDLFSALKNRRFDGIAAHLPYVTEREYSKLPAEVRDFEPRFALVAPRRGLELIFRAIDELENHLNPGGFAVFELSPSQAPQAAERLRAHGFAAEIRLDLCRRRRFVAGWKK